MFANQAENALMKGIMDASRFYLDHYVEGIRALPEEADPAELKKQILAVRRDYLDLVANSILNSFEKDRPDIAQRIRTAMVTPQLCGYSGISSENGFSAGALFAICLYAVENRAAVPNDCVSLNRQQNRLMEDAVASLD